MASNQNRNSGSRSSSARGINGTFLGCVVLGICILIAGLSISGSLKKLSTALTETTFSDTNSFNAPSALEYTEVKYLDETEAAAYLRITENEFLNLIKEQEITEYVKTSTGYAVSVEVLDSWFDNVAYQNTLGTEE